jgi:hypothetical protein
MAGPPKHIVQLLAWRNVLLALTETGTPPLSEIWMLHGYDALPPGSEPVALAWRRLTIELPPDEESPGPP